MDEVTIVDRVQVDLDDLGKLDHHVAIPPAEPAEVAYISKKTGYIRRKRVFAFTATGNALVLPDDGTRLVTAYEGAHSSERVRLERAELSTESPVGPFTPAPPGLTAVFKDGDRFPVTYYDVHGRPICIDKEPTSRALFVVDETDEQFDHIEGDPQI